MFHRSRQTRDCSVVWRDFLKETSDHKNQIERFKHLSSALISKDFAWESVQI